jgi:hypothetical protein
MLVNLIPIKCLETAARRRRIQRWLVIVPVFTALLVVVGVSVRSSISTPSADQRAEIAKDQDRLSVAAERRATLERTRRALVQRLEAARTAGQHPDWSLLLRSLSAVRGHQIALTAIEVSTARIDISSLAESGDAAKKPGAKPTPLLIDEARVQLVGVAGAPGSVFEFALELEKLDIFDAVRVKDARTGGTQSFAGAPAGSTTFEIEAVVRGSTRVGPGRLPTDKSANARAGGES